MQFITLMLGNKPSAPYQPINSDRSYSAIINTKLKKEELISKTKELFLEEGLADSAQLSTVTYDENLSEYKLRFGFKNGQSKSKGMMGITGVSPAVILYFDAIFSFNNFGQIKITFIHFDSYVLANIDESGYLSCYKGGKSNGKVSEPILPTDTAVWNEYQTILITESMFGKALLWANGGIDMLNKAKRGDFLKNLKSKFEMYQDACQNGSCVWISKADISNYKMKNNKYWDEQVAKFKSDQLVISVDNYRWENYFELNFNYIFKEIANLVSGKIEGIALDGNITYDTLEGKLLPVDLKERKIWQKKNIEF